MLPGDKSIRYDGLSFPIGPAALLVGAADLAARTTTDARAGASLAVVILRLMERLPDDVRPAVTAAMRQRRDVSDVRDAALAARRLALQ